MNGQAGEPQKEYILYFYDGRVRREFGRLSEFQKLPVSRIEEVPSVSPPALNIQRDMERLNKALGEGVTRLEQVVGPQQLLDRIEAGLEYPVRLASDIPGQLLGQVKLSLDSFWQRRQ